MHLQKFIDEVLTIKEDESKSFSVSVLDSGCNSIGFESAIRLLENRGFSIGAITQNFKYPIYISEGVDEKGYLKGWGLEKERPLKIIATNIGLPIKSLKPKEPQTNIKGLKLVPHYSMAICKGTKNEGWQKIHQIPHSSISISIADTSGIQYGQSAFEGACAMKNKKNETFGFRLNKNIKRFNKSIESLCLPPINEKDLLKSLETTISNNTKYIPEYNKGKLYIRPSVAGLYGGLGIIVPDIFVITIEIAAFGDYFPFSIDIEALKNIHRPETGVNKIASNYASSFLIKKGVKERGYTDYLSFTKDGFVEEVATCAVGFINKENKFIFPPVQDEIDNKKRNILPSITRKSIIEILKYKNAKIEIRDVHVSEIKKMDNMFTMGNAVGVLFIEKLCLKDNEEDKGEIINFNLEKKDTINKVKEYLFSARLGELENFEDWVKKL
jgi:branched-chain amino acid aminotransferase